MADSPRDPHLIETPAEKEARERAEDERGDRRRDKLQLWFNGILMLATIVTAVIVLYQNRIMVQSLNEQKTQSVAATRTRRNRRKLAERQSGNVRKNDRTNAGAG